jgi:hypothetical protein
MQVFSGGVVDTVTISGGFLELHSGATAGTSTITFAGGGTLKLDGTGSYGLRIAGFAASDAIELSAVGSPTATEQYAGDASSGTLAVGDGPHSVSLQLLGTYTSGSFSLGAEIGGATGTIVTTPPASGALGGSSVTAGQKSAATDMPSGDLAFAAGQNGIGVAVAGLSLQDYGAARDRAVPTGQASRLADSSADHPDGAGFVVDTSMSGQPNESEPDVSGSMPIMVASHGFVPIGSSAPVAAMVGPEPSERDLATALFFGGIAIPGAGRARRETRKAAKPARVTRAPVVTFDLGGDRFEGPSGAIVEAADLPPVIETTGEGVEWTVV